MVSSRRALLTSPPAISHHQWSVVSVLKTMRVPWYDSRARSTCSASCSLVRWSGKPCTRLSTLIQSITALVGH